MDSPAPPVAEGVRVGRLVLGAFLAVVGAALFLAMTSGTASADEIDAADDGSAPITLDTQIVDDAADADGDAQPLDADVTDPEPVVEEITDDGAETDDGLERSDDTATTAPLTLDAQPESELEGDVATTATAPDCGSCSSDIDQELVSRTFDTDHWTIVIEATLDSNVVCHLFLFQCVVQPEQSPTNMSLVGVECLSPGWAHIYLDVLGFTRDVCARFDHHHAGTDQRFRFTYRTDPGVVSGTVSEKVIFYRFPEEIFFVRAMDTIVVDLDVELDVTKTCPDTVTAGTSSSCTITLIYPGQGPAVTTVSMTDTPPAEFVNGALTHTSGSGTWNCVALTCSLVGNYSPGDATTFTLSFDVTPSADGEVVNTANGTWDSGSASDTAEVTIGQPTDTTLSIIKIVDGARPRPGDPLRWTIIVTNEGPVAALNVRVSDMPGEFVRGAHMRFDSGVGVWACTLVECTTASMPLGDAVFVVNGFVADNAPPGTVITNEAEVEWDNDIFGPDFPIRVGAQVVVAEPPPAPPTPSTPSAPGPTPVADRAGTLPMTGSGGLTTLVVAGLLLVLAGAVLLRVDRRGI